MNLHLLDTAAFIAGTAAIVWFSWKPLRQPRSHGFYRTFAWEFIWVLFLLNYRYWFDQVFSPLQIVSWLLLIASAVMVTAGMGWLRLKGKADASRRDDPALLGLEKTTVLVTTGVYRYIRHPLYGATVLLAWGICLKHLSWPGAVLIVAATVCLALTMRIEEAENLAYFGPAYAEYRKRSKWFVPFVF
jgi:protein-S-isoprenylcysteine O-methyltransferase Ste14